MKRTSLDVLACPLCCGGLQYKGQAVERIWGGVLVCARCQKVFAIDAGIPGFVQPEASTDTNSRFSRLYDCFS